MSRSFWVCLVVAVAACASTPTPKSFKLGTVAMPRSHFLVTAALAITQTVCEDPRVRNYLTVADAECVRAVGDRLISAGRFDMQEMSAPEQQKWLHEVAEPLVTAALKPYDARGAAVSSSASPRHLGSLVAHNSQPRGHLCIRMQDDPTPCPATLAPAAKTSR